MPLAQMMETNRDGMEWDNGGMLGKNKSLESRVLSGEGWGVVFGRGSLPIRWFLVSNITVNIFYWKNTPSSFSRKKGIF
jgi:hypothetical protein